MLNWDPVTWFHPPNTTPVKFFGKTTLAKGIRKIVDNCFVRAILPEATGTARSVG